MIEYLVGVLAIGADQLLAIDIKQVGLGVFLILRQLLLQALDLCFSLGGFRFGGFRTISQLGSSFWVACSILNSSSLLGAWACRADCVQSPRERRKKQTPADKFGCQS